MEPFGQNTLRFRSSRSVHITDENWNILPQTDIKSNIQILKGMAIISNGNIRAEVREKDGLITYFNEKNEMAADVKWTVALFDLQTRKIISPTPKWLETLGLRA